MKKVFLLLVIITICSSKGFGQIVKMDSIISMKTSSDIGKIYVDLRDDKNVEKFYFHNNGNLNIYNLNGTTYKNLALSHPLGTSDVWVWNLSTHLFNDDDLVEIVYSYYSSSTNSHTIKIIDENNNLLYELENEGYESLLSTPNKEFLLVTHDENWSFKSIYKINPIKTSISQAKIQLQKLPFPNPSKTTVNLPYQLSVGQQTTMKIFDVNGKTITTKQIDAAMDKLQLDVSGYAKGMYLYEYNGKSGKFVVE